MYCYVSEPDAIDCDKVSSLLGANHTVSAGDVSFINSEQLPYDTLIIRSGTTVDRTIVDHFPKLQNIVRVGTGLDNVDVEFCSQNDIRLFNAAGANADAVAEYTVTMLLFALRKLYLLSDEAVSGWDRFKFNGQGLADQSIGIIGFGHIGRLTYQKLTALGCSDFVAYDPYVAADGQEHQIPFVDLQTLIKKSTVIVIHAPLTPETKGLIAAEQLKSLNQGTIVINDSRGDLVDEDDLLSVLETRQDVIYIADTVHDEPHVNPALLDRQNIIVTPHIASLTDASQRKMLEAAIANLLNSKTCS